LSETSILGALDVNEVYEPKCNNENRSLRPICPIVCLGQEEKPGNNFE